MEETYERKLPKLDLNITNRCNFRCAHCAFDSGIVDINEMNLNELEKILKETKELGGKRIDITGGEPLVRQDVEEIIRLCKKYEFKTELVTNASLLDSDRLQRFQKLGLDGIAISLDGSQPQIYNRIRRKDEETFYKIIDNIKKSKQYGFYTKVNTVVFQSNLEDIPNIVGLCVNMGIDELGLYYFTPIGRGNRENELSVEPVKWLDFIRTKLKPYASSRLKISLELPLIEETYWNTGLGCIAGTEQSHLQILPNGNTYPCAILASYDKPVANLNGQSIKEIWKNKELWEKYWGDVYSLFKSLGCGDSCVNFKQAFDLNDYAGYKFVCPLRKFELKEIK